MLESDSRLPVVERYRSPVDLSDLNNPRTLAVLSIPQGARVLDVGCGPGDVARALSERGCSVTAIELDPKAAEAARPYCEQILVADAETLDFERVFAGAGFDAVLFLDVLEHLRDPAGVLRRVAPLLGDRGKLLASVPNVAHGALRLALLAGRFPYSETGLLDRTHLRFFDAPGVQGLFREAGYRITQTLRVVRELDETEIPIRLSDFPKEAVQMIRSDPEALTYQFVLTAVPADRAHRAAASLGEALQQKIRELRSALSEGAAHARHLEAELSGKEARIAELERVLAERMAELDALNQGRTYLEADVLLKDEYIVELRTQAAGAEEGRRELEAARRELEERLAAAQRELQDLHAEVRRRQELIDAIHRTRTWRLRSRIRRLIGRSA